MRPLEDLTVTVTVIVAVAAVAGPKAHAEAHDPHKAMVSLLSAQVRALDAHDAKAFAATFIPDGFAVLPAAADEGQGTVAIEAATRRWLSRLGDATVKLDKPHYGTSWYDAELVVTPGGRLRITGVLAGGFSEDPSAYYQVGAVHISEAADDKAVLAAAAAGKLPALPRLPPPPSDAGNDATRSTDGPDKIAAFAKHLYSDPEREGPMVAVVGSAAAEHAIGKAAVAKLLTGWRSLKLSTVECRGMSDQNDMVLHWRTCHVEATLRTAGRTVKVPYRVLMIVEEPLATTAELGATSLLLAAHFSVATR